MLALARAILSFMLIAGAVAAASAPAQAADGCPGLRPADIELNVDAPDGLESGRPFSLAWTSSHRDCDLPHYLIVALPERVRFSGDGAIALAPGERAPYDIGYRADAMRLAVPLHLEEARAGALSVIPFLTGTFGIDWAVVVPEAGGARILEGDSIRPELKAGSPKIVVQDLYAAERPVETARSGSGDYRLDIFEGYFRVTDTLTGALVVAAEGYRPGFSPTSRFLHVFGDKASQFRVFDLYSETLVVDLDREGAGGRGFFVQGLEWSAGDSFLMVAYEAAGAVGFKEMLFDRPFRYQAEGCGSCPPDETIVVLDVEEAVVALGRGGFGDVYGLAADRQIVDVDSGDIVPLLVSLDPAVSSPAQRPSRYAREADEPDWFLNGPRTASLDYRDGVPIFVAGASTGPAAGQDAAVVGDWEVLRRGAVTLSRTDLINRDSRIAERLSAFGINLRPTPSLVSERLTFLHMLEDYDAYDEDDYARADDLYRIEPGRAALARGLASAETARAIDEKVFHLTREHHSCGLASPNRAFDGQAQLWSWRQGGNLHQVVHYYCYVSTGSIPAGVAFLITARDGEADYAVLGETIDGEMELSGSYDLEPWVPEDKSPSLVDIHMYGALRVFRPGNDLLALLNAQGSLAVYDIARREMRFSVEEVVEFANVVNVAVTADGRHVVQINDNGRFFAYETSTGAHVLSGRYLDDEVVVYDDDLRFDATPEGAAHVHLKFPGDRNLYQLSQFEAALRAPGMVPLRLAGRTGPSGAAAVASPPAVTLTLASGRQAGRAATVRIEAGAAGGLSEIAIYRDGRAVEVVPVEGQGVSIERDVAVHAETRWLAARAKDVGGAYSMAAVVRVTPAPPAAAAAAGRLFVVVVGTDVYDDPRISRLNYAASDARSFAKALGRSGSGYYRETFVEVLEDAPHLSEALPNAIGAAASRMTDADTLFVYIAGHGLLGEDGGLYLADRATRIDDVPGTALAWPRLSEALSSAPGRIFLFLDACHSGAAGMATNDDAVDSLLVSSDDPVTVIAASKGRQFSFEGARFAGGVFTSALTAIFSDILAHDDNGNGVLEFSELYRALKQRVVSQTRGEQIPWVSRFGLVGDAPVL